jgi:hypothetical protein
MRSSFRTSVIAATAVVFGFSSAAMAVTKKRPWSDLPAGQCVPEWWLDDPLDPLARLLCNKAVPTGLSFSGSFGYASTASNFSVFDTFLLDRRGDVASGLVTPTGRAGFGGVSLALTSPNLFPVGGAQGRYQQGGIHIGVEGGMDFFGDSSATNQVFPGGGTVSDTISFKPTSLTHVAGVVHIPIGWPESPTWWALSDFYGKVGGGWSRSDLTYNFSMLTPTVPAFSATQSTTQAGLYWGVGFGTPLPVKKGWRAPPPILSFEFDQFSTGSRDVIFGAPATRQVSATLGPERFNMYRVNLTQPFVASDVRLKRDIVALGRLDNGLTLYRYRYLWSEELFVGVMAQEVAELVPQAVTLRPEGYLAVDYAQLGLRLQTWDEWVSSH